MAHGQQEQGHVKAIGAVERNAAAGPAAEVRGHHAPADARRADEANPNQAPERRHEANREQALPANQPADNLNLTPEAQAEQEKRRQEEEEKKQAEIDALMAEIEQTKQQIETARHQKDGPRVEQLTHQLEGLEVRLGGLVDGVQGNAGAHGAPAAGHDTPDLIPRPPGGVARGGRNLGGGNIGGGVPFRGGLGGFNPALQGTGGGPRGMGGNHAPAANPNVQIPDFGPKASKAQVGQMLDAASEKYGIPANILKAVAWQESGWNQKALSFDGQHGKGVMQIDDRFHAFARTSDVFDPAKNIDYGAKYLKDLYEKTGSWAGALKRYNGGSDYPPKVLALAEKQPWAQYT